MMLLRAPRTLRRFMVLLGCAASVAQSQAADPADAAFTRSDWPTAGRLYRAIVDRDSTNLRAQFRLGIALFEQRQFAAAIPAFERTAHAGFQPVVSEFRLTRAHAQLGHVDAALTHLERAASAGIDPELVRLNPDIATLRNEARYTAVLQRLDDARFPCRRGTEAHQFDFWLGEWTVTPWASDASAAPIGHNSVTTDLEQCVVNESWTPRSGHKGRSVNFWDTNRQAWRQVWVSADGTSLDYEGHLVDNAMRFTGWTLGTNGKKVMQKLTFFRMAADTVRQLFEASDDEGATWKSTFDGRYVRARTTP